MSIESRPSASSIQGEPVDVQADPADWREQGRRLRLLRGVELFRGVPWDLLSEIAASLEARALEAGDLICREGGPAEAFYVIEEGALVVTHHGEAQPVARLGPGQSFGDMALLGGDHYTASVSAEARAKVWSLSADDFGELSAKSPSLERVVRLSEARMAEWSGLEVETAEDVSSEGPLGLRIDICDVSRELRDGRRILDEISFSVAAGELVAIVGGSGAGKTTLLHAIAGIEPASSGRIEYNGANYYEALDNYRHWLGYVPQEDIVHRELPVRRTLEYAARLRLPGTAPDERDQAITEVLQVLDLEDRESVRVGALSGGQRKRTCIGAELLTRPRVFFLDEPTSGLDPATEADMMRLLRRLADQGSTIVLTTHSPEDIAVCDKVVFLARGGRLAFVGRPHESLEFFECASFGDIYERLAREATPELWAARFEESRLSRSPEGQRNEGPPVAQTPGREAGTGFLRQWTILTRRNVDILVRSPLTLAILIGSPILIIMMFALLFRPGAFDYGDPSPGATLMILFWVSFGAFFFGLTYGLLQICTEFPIFRRERLVNLQILPYVLSKAAVLAPILVAIVILMLGVLRAFDQLPSAGSDVYLELAVTLSLGAFAALALGLLTSAAVSSPEQATIALPLLCFPQVLFSGAILAVPIMAELGKVLSVFLSTRWTFEGLGTSTDLNDLFANGNSDLGPPLLEQYGDTFSRDVVAIWLLLAAFTVALLALTVLVLRQKGMKPQR